MIFLVVKLLFRRNLSPPPAGSYTKIVALVDKKFKMATHQVMLAGTNNPANGITYVSTANGGAIGGCWD